MKKYFLLSITLLISIFIYTDNVNALIETNYADFPDLPTDLSSNYSEQKYAIAKKNDTGDTILLIYNNNTEFLRIWSTMIEENNLLHDNDNNFVISGTYFDSSNRAGNSTYRWYYLRNNQWYFNKELSGTIGVSEIYYFNFQGIEMYNSSSEKIYENFGIKDTGPTVYKFNENVDLTNKSYIRINYDTTETNYESQTKVTLIPINERLKEAYYEKSWYFGACYDKDHCYDDYVFRENIYYNPLGNLYSYSVPFKYEDIDHGFYDETQELNEFYMYFDVSNINEIVEISIESNAPFEIEYGEMENYIDSFEKINLKYYAGLVIFPIVNDFNGDYNFQLENVDINIHQYYNNELIDVYKNITSNNYYFSNIEHFDINRYFIIENNKINEDSYIILNKKYFKYYYIDNKDDFINVNNPNTNESQNLPSIDSSNLANEIKNNIFNISGYLSIENGITAIFTNFYNLIRNSLLGNYVFLIILFSIILLVIKSSKR